MLNMTNRAQIYIISTCSYTTILNILYWIFIYNRNNKTIDK